MQLKQRFSVAHPRSSVWEFFGRMEDVTPCLPGASLTEPPAGNAAKFKLNVKLGPIAAAFVGDAEIERQPDDYHGVIRGNARDSRGDSRVKGVVDYSLSEEAGGNATGVDINVDFTLTGRLAQFSRGGIVNDLAARLTADFARNLEAAMTSPTQVMTPAAAEAASAKPVGTRAPAAAPSSGTPAAPERSSARGDGTLAAPAAAPSRPAPSRNNELDAGSLFLAVLWGRIKAFFGALFGRR